MNPYYCAFVMHSLCIVCNCIKNSTPFIPMFLQKNLLQQKLNRFNLSIIQTGFFYSSWRLTVPNCIVFSSEKLQGQCLVLPRSRDCPPVIGCFNSTYVFSGSESQSPLHILLLSILFNYFNHGHAFFIN